MYVRLVLTHFRGVPRPKRHIVRAEGLTGDLVTTYREDAHLRRTILVATFITDALVDTRRPMELFDARCVLVSAAGILFAGLVREPVERGGYAEHAQGWWLRPEPQVTHRDIRIEDPRNPPAGTCEGHREPAANWTKRLK